jgi:hypothetical protein
MLLCRFNQFTKRDAIIHHILMVISEVHEADRTGGKGRLFLACVSAQLQALELLLLIKPQLTQGCTTWLHE